MIVFGRFYIAFRRLKPPLCRNHSSPGNSFKLFCMRAFINEILAGTVIAWDRYCYRVWFYGIHYLFCCGYHAYRRFP